MSSPADDPVREDVERALRRILDVTVVTPWLVATWAPRCVIRRLGALTGAPGPRAAVRTVVDLAQQVTSPAETTSTPAPPASTLPIEEYESLAASQVVTRLGLLAPAALHAVRDFEAAHRGRRTILGKIDQLLA